MRSWPSAEGSPGWPGPPPSPLVDRVLHLARLLRTSGVEVSTGELIDAVRALGHLDLADRGTLRAGLRATLAKEPAAVARFDRLFDVVFRTAPGADDGASGVGARPPSAPPSGPPPAPAAVADAVLAALRAGDRDALQLLAARAVALYSGMADGEGSERHFLHRVLRALDLSRMLSAAMQQLRRDGELTELELALRRGELVRLLEEFRRQLAAELAGRMAARPGPLDEVDVPPAVDPADRELVRLAPAERAELRRLVRPLALQLAARVGRRRRARVTGRVDLRRTVRRSLQSGGVPMDLVLRRRHPHRPEVMLLCDVSGSVADFAQFTFSLVHALHDELRRVRSFAFVDGVAEVTDLFEHAAYDVPVARFVERRGVIRLDGHSDYGAVFGQFGRDFLHDVTSRTTVIVTGDARGNYRDPGGPAFRAIAARARRVFWLNPTPASSWDAEDAVMAVYRPYCDGAFEVRTLRQLADVIARLV